MAIKNKKLYAIYLDEKKTDYVKSFLETTRNKGGFSALMDSYIATMYYTLKASGYKQGEKVKISTILKIAKNGLIQNLA